MSRRESGIPGRPYILCNWAECSADAHEQYRVRIDREAHDEGEALWAQLVNRRLSSIMLFCSERHKALWVNSVKDNNNLPMGQRGTIL